jgi:hypothetical protein
MQFQWDLIQVVRRILMTKRALLPLFVNCFWRSAKILIVKV